MDDVSGRELGCKPGIVGGLVAHDRNGRSDGIQAVGGSDPRERLDTVRAGQSRTPTGRRRRHDCDTDRPVVLRLGPRRDPPQQGGQEFLVTGQELATPVKRDRATHSGPTPSSGGVTFLIGGFGGSPVPPVPPGPPRPRPRATIRDSRSGAAMNGAR